MPREKPATTWDELPVVLDIPLASRIIGINRDVLTRKCQRGEIPAHKVMNRWRILKEELHDYILNH